MKLQFERVGFFSFAHASSSDLVVGLLSSRIGKTYIHLSDTLGDVFRKIFVLSRRGFADRILYIDPLLIHIFVSGTPPINSQNCRLRHLGI